MRHHESVWALGEMALRNIALFLGALNGKFGRTGTDGYQAEQTWVDFHGHSVEDDG